MGKRKKKKEMEMGKGKKKKEKIGNNEDLKRAIDTFSFTKKNLDTSKCTLETSLYQKFFTEFNLGNGKFTNDPIEAATYLLKRRYSKTHLFHDKHPTEPIFIPDVFKSSVFNYNYKEDFKRSLSNLKKNEPGYWFTKELDEFMKLESFKNDDYIRWKERIKDSKSFQEDKNPHFVLNWMMEKDIPTISGEECESLIFYELQKSIPNDFIVLYSYKLLFDDHFVRNKTEQEFDFLLFSAERKIIIGMEVKRSLHDSNAFKQLKTYREIIEKRFGDQLDNEWIFIPVLCVLNSSPYLKEHPNDLIYTNEFNMKKWLADLLSNYPEEKPENKNKLKITKDQLKNTLKIITFLSHIVAPKHNGEKNYITEALNAISTSNNIMFYSDNQLEVMFKDKCKKVIFLGGYGTGKSFLLHEKAKAILEQKGEKVLFVFGQEGNEKKSLLQLSLEDRWKGYDNITIMNRYEIQELQNDTKETAETSLLKFIEKRITVNKEHVFIDEWQPKLLASILPKFSEEPDQTSGNCVDFLSFEAIANSDMFVWIVMQHDYSTVLIPIGSDPLASQSDSKVFKNSEIIHKFKKICSKFEIPRLGGSLRNSKNITEHAIPQAEKEFTRYYNINFSGFNRVAEPFNNIPRGPKPTVIKIVDNNVEKSIEDAMKQCREETDKCILLLLSSCSDILMERPNHVKRAEDRIKDISKKLENVFKGQSNVRYYFNRKLVQDVFDKIFDERHSIGSSECWSHLQQDKNVLITDMKTAEGFEWSDVIVCQYPKELKQMNMRKSEANAFMRCTSNLIVISEEIQYE